MINMDVLRGIAEGGPAEEFVPISRRAIREIVRDMERLQGAGAMAKGQAQLDAVLNTIRYERPLGQVVRLVVGEDA